MDNAPDKSTEEFPVRSSSASMTAGLFCFFAWTFAMLCLGDDMTPADLDGFRSFFTGRLFFLMGTAAASLLCILIMKQLSHPHPLLLGTGTLLASAYLLTMVVPSSSLSSQVSMALWMASGAGEAIWFFVWVFRLRTLTADRCRSAICGAMSGAGILTFFLAFMYTDLMMICIATLPIIWLVCFTLALRLPSGSDLFEGLTSKSSEQQTTLGKRCSFIIASIRKEGLSKVLLKGLHSFMFAYLFGIVVVVTLSIDGPTVVGAAMGLMMALSSLILHLSLKKDDLLTSTLIINAFVPLSCISLFGIALMFPAPAIVIFAALTGALTTMLWIMGIMSSFNYLSFLPIRFIFEGWSAKACSSVGVTCGWIIAGLVVAFEPGDGSLATLVLFGSICVMVILDDVFFKKMRLVMSKTIVSEEEQVAVQETATILPFSPKEDRWLEACDALAERHGLSPRQKEVFLLLANGRNTEYITGALGLSTPTVKTHTYAVYQKLGIHSHQALIDLIERTAFNG